MRTYTIITAILLGFLLLAGEVAAKQLEWAGTTTTKLGAGRPQAITITGVATVNGTAQALQDWMHVNTLRLAGATTMGDPIPVTDPEVTGLIRSFIVDASADSGTFAPISGGAPLTMNKRGARGTAKICLILAGCPSFLPLFLSQNDGNTGFGVGGVLTVGGAGAIRISLNNNPWTLGQASAKYQTDNSAIVTQTITGFVHGPGSNTSSTALASGVIQLITPTQVTTIGIPGSNDKISLFGTLRVHFVPEPGMLLLLGSGVVALVLMGRSRRS